MAGTITLSDALLEAGSLPIKDRSEPVELYQAVSNISDTGSIKIRGNVAVQITGTATSISYRVQRSTKDPSTTPNWAFVGDTVTGNPSTGINVDGYIEPSSAWWRVKVTAISGIANISISGLLG